MSKRVVWLRTSFNQGFVHLVDCLDILTWWEMPWHDAHLNEEWLRLYKSGTRDKLLHEPPSVIYTTWTL